MGERQCMSVQTPQETPVAWLSESTGLSKQPENRKIEEDKKKNAGGTRLMPAGTAPSTQWSPSHRAIPQNNASSTGRQTPAKKDRSSPRSVQGPTTLQHQPL